MDPVFNGLECLVTNHITVVNMSNKQTITALNSRFVLAASICVVWKRGKVMWRRKQSGKIVKYYVNYSFLQCREWLKICIRKTESRTKIIIWSYTYPWIQFDIHYAFAAQRIAEESFHSESWCLGGEINKPSDVHARYYKHDACTFLEGCELRPLC